MNPSANSHRVVLVTGGSGFVGYHALPYLQGQFDEVHATWHTSAPGARHDHTIWHSTDLLCEASMRHLIAEVRPTHLLHLAWYVEHGQFWNDPINTRWLDASFRLAAAFAAAGGQRIVTAGSCAEYDWSVGYCRELQTPCAPASLYGTCKHALQLAVASLPEVSSAHARTFHLFGPREDERRLVPSVIRSLARGEAVHCTHGHQVRDFMYVKDVAAAHVQLLLSDVRGPVNVASGAPQTLRQLIAAIADKMGRPEAVNFGAVPQRPGEPLRLTARTARLHDEVGFRPTYTLDRAIDETIAAHAQQHARQAKPKATATMPACPLCRCTNTIGFLRRTDVPVHQHLIHRDATAARTAARGTLDMQVCSHCGFVFNAAFDPQLLSYGAQYDNTQTCSPTFDRYVDELARHLLEDCGIRDQTIVEIGCGKGGFLRKLVEDPATGNRGCGFDPTYQGPESDLDGRLQFRRQFFDATTAEAPCDTVVCRHVIEHVAHPDALITTIRNALRDCGPQAHVFLETPCMDWILDRGVVWDFFYEHCSLFTARSLQYAFEMQGFHTTDIRHIFGGQYLWLAAAPRAEQKPIQAAHVSAGSMSEGIVERALAYAQYESGQLAHWKAAIQSMAEAGGVALWGAGAKGVTFANLIDPGGTIIDCTVDVNPAKQGAFLPGTGTPIVSPQALAARRVAHVVVLNPNYLHEIQQQLQQLEIAARVVDLGSHPHSQNDQNDARSLFAA